ncbi:PP2C family protein-serine/threonine phosphatase [Streptomyces sp. N35]|uniref:PP2C family protein-serine/threonine phosphatase n=1 Tax=Streptomyces sp. N35 TaxID=2795730 RepID=UPI0018F52979|nr:PP2C family protein-serine/threonine phosphatase [Streptomyces sp. N35]
MPAATTRIAHELHEHELHELHELPERPHERELDDTPILQIMEGAPHGILIASALRGGTALYANARLGDIFGARVATGPGELYAASTAIFDRNGEPLAFEDSPLGITLRTRRPASAELQYRVPGEPVRWMDITTTPLDCPRRGPVAVAYVHDISSRRHAALELDEANRRLGQQLDDLTWVHRLTEELTEGASLEDTLARVLAEGAQLLHAEFGVARVLDEQGQMRTRAVHGVPPGKPEMHQALQEIGPQHLLVADILSEGGSTIIEDVLSHPSIGQELRDLALSTGFRALYALALPGAGGKPVAAVAWAFAQAGRPTSRQRQLTETYCRFAGQIAENNHLYEREHTIASTLQQSMLAPRLPDVPGLQIAACSLPGAQGMQAGGDWYDVVAFDDGTAGLALGDVMGKGLGAAAAMGQMRTALRSYALVEGQDPAAVLTDLNALTVDMSLTDMATVLYAHIDPAARRAVLASAGHCPPLLVDGEGARFLRAGQGVPLGVVDDWSAEQEAVDLAPGSLLILYTDGLVERRGEELGVGLERLRQSALAAPTEVGELCARLMRDCLDDGVGPDDVAILAVRLR